MDSELFGNYSRIFLAILADTISNDNYDDNTLIETIISLKCSIDGLIIHGTNEETEELQSVILDHYMYSKNKKLRQVTIEGICKMLFSIKFSGKLEG